MSRTRAAFTLLEVLLTMLIVGILVAAIATAIQVHYRVVDAGRAEVEQAQLARVLLGRIAADLRATVPIPSNDSGGSADAIVADAVASAGASSGGSSSSGGGSSSGSGSSGGSSSGLSSGSSSAALSSAASSATETESSDDTTAPPTFFGAASELQVDVGRLPAAHQFAAATADAALSGALNPAAALSDVKTVWYYVGGATATMAGTDPFAALDPNEPVVAGGLIRRELSRAAAVFGSTQGGLDPSSNEHLLAAEVVALEFHYYDGSQWLMDWDSATSGTLPTCVEIWLTLRSASPGVASDPLSLFAAQGEVLEKTYRLVVDLPAAAASTSSSSESSSSESETEL